MPLRQFLPICVLLAAALLKEDATAASTEIIASQLDRGCASISYNPDSNQLLVTDAAGKVFIGDIRSPTQQLIISEGEVSQARFISKYRKILLVYKSGAVETIDPINHESVLERLPPYSYSEMRVSSNGQWAIGLAIGKTHADIFKLDSGITKPIFSYDHPRDAAMEILAISDSEPLIALLDEQGKIQIVDMLSQTVKPLESKKTKSSATAAVFIGSSLWLSEENTHEKLIAYQTRGNDKKKIEGISIFQSNRILNTSTPSYFIASDDLGFYSLAQKKSDTTNLTFNTLGPMRLAPGLVEAVAIPELDILILCQRDLEFSELKGGKPLTIITPRVNSGVYIENVTQNGELALIRDMKGRAAVWHIEEARFVGTLPRLPIETFPSFATLEEKTKVYLSFGQENIVTLARPTSLLMGVTTPSYSTEAIPLKPTNTQEPWRTRAIFSRKDTNEAYIVRPNEILKLTWPSNFQSVSSLANIIEVGANKADCSEFNGVASPSSSDRYLAVACKEGIAVFDLNSRHLLALTSPPAWEKQNERFATWIPGLSFSSDERFVAFAVRAQHLYLENYVSEAHLSQHPSIYVLDWRSAKVKTVQDVPHVPIISVALSLDGRHLWAGGYWGSVTVYDVETGDVRRKVRGIYGHVLGIVPTSDGGATVWTDSGNLVQISSKPEYSAIRSVSFFDRGEASILFGRNANPTPSSDDPTLIELHPRAFFERKHRGDELEVTILARGQHRNPTEILLYSEGEVVSRGSLIKKNSEDHLQVRFKVPNHINGHISLGLFSIQGGASPLIYLGTIAERQSTSGTPRIIGALVGIGSYNHPDLPELPNATRDAEALSIALGNRRNIIRVFPKNQSPTKETVLGFIETLRDMAEPGDTLLIHLSGHGVTNQDRSFIFATKETDPWNPKSPGITSAELIDTIARGRQGSTLLIIDACNGGSFIDGLLQDPRMSEGPLFLGNESRGLENSVAVIAAAPAFHVAKEGYKGLGLLTGVLIDGLTQLEKRNKSGVVTQSDLLHYIDRALPQISFTAFPTKIQQPVLHYAVRDFNISPHQREEKQQGN